MAVRGVTIGEAGNGAMTATWADLDAGDSGAPVALAGWPTKTLQIIGGTTVDIQGSNDGGTTWAALSTVAAVALTTVAPGVYTIRENTLLIRPNNVAGNNMSIILVAARA